LNDTPSIAYAGAGVLDAMTYATNYNAALLELITSEQPDRSARILDFGAGLGTYVDMLTELGYSPDCLEVDEGLCHALAAKGYQVTTEVGSLEPRSYDLIYALNVLEHIENDLGTMRRLSELLAPGGRLLIYVPASLTLYSAFDKLVGHYRRYTRAGLRVLADAAGLDVVELRYCDPLGWPTALVFKLVGNKDGNITPRSVAAYDRAVFPLSKRLEAIFGQTFGKNVLLVAEFRPR
jgi:SAM-dependent methyltransferase